MTEEEIFEAIIKNQVFEAELKTAITEHITPRVMRYLVSLYYQQQKVRKSAANKVIAAEKDGDMSGIMQIVTRDQIKFESKIKTALKIAVQKFEIGRWMLSVKGVGPVSAAAIIAFLDIHKAPSASHFWSLCGWAGKEQKKWEPGQLRPWNATLRAAMWNLGQVFKKNPDSFYGQRYRFKKEYYKNKNEAGDFSERAAKDKSKYNKSTDAYKHCSEGHLPPAHIDSMACRDAAKLFLAHVHEIWWKMERPNEPAPKPYPIQYMGHVHYIAPPQPEEPSKRRRAA
jgi:hypothetical protein